MFAKTHLQILLFIALKTLVVVSAQTDEDQTSLPQTEVDQVLDGIESKTADTDIFLEDLDLPKNDNADNNTTNIRRWAPYPQDLPEVTSEKSPPSTSSSPWNSSPAGQPHTYQPQKMRSSTVNPWISDFWNSLPVVTEQPALETLEPSGASLRDIMMPTRHINLENNALPNPQSFDNNRQPTYGNSEQPKTNQGSSFGMTPPNFSMRQNQAPKSPKPAGPNPLEAFSPENGKTGIERPLLAAGLPTFRREEPMRSTTNNPRVFPMTLFYDDNKPLDQDTMPTFQPAQTPASELPSQEQMRSIENAPVQKDQQLNYYHTRQQMPQLQIPFKQMQVPFQQMQVPQLQQEQMPEKQQPSQSYLGPMDQQQQEQQVPMQQHSYDSQVPSSSAEDTPSESKSMGQQLMDAHVAFGKALADFVSMCENEKKVSVQMEKNFGPFYILTGAFPQGKATGQLISAWKTK